MGATTTILLPAGRSVSTAVDARRRRRTACRRRPRQRAPATGSPRAHAQGVSVRRERGARTSTDATREIERYLKRGAVLIAEQKFGVECDSPEMQRIYQLAQAHRVPVLMHWQFEMYNYGFERFHKMLEKYPRVNFLGHAQTWWANIDRNHRDQGGALSEGPGDAGRPDRPLSERLREHVRRSVRRVRPERADARRGLHARLPDASSGQAAYSAATAATSDGSGPKCQGAQTIAAVRRLAASQSDRAEAAPRQREEAVPAWVNEGHSRLPLSGGRGRRRKAEVTDRAVRRKPREVRQAEGHEKPSA